MRMPQKLKPEDALTKSEAADHAGVTPRTIQRWISEGYLTRYTTRVNRVMVSKRQLDRILVGRKSQ